MTPADKPEFARLLNGLAAIKPGAKLTAEGLDVWWLAMQDWPIEEFRAATAHLAKSVEFMPSPFQFEQLRRAGLPTAGEAWAEALDRVRHGRYPTGDAAIERAVAALGGWRVIAMSTDEGLPFLERRFAEHFEALEDAQALRRALPAIAHRRARLDGPATMRALLGEGLRREDA